MAYRNPIRQRQAAQTNEIIKYAGFTATWRQYVSASAGVSVAGFGSANYYREQTVTAVFGGGVVGGGVVNANLQRQLGMGQQEAGTVRVTTQEKLSKFDEFIWNGVRYRVDTDSQFSPLNGYYMSILTRGDN